LIEIWIYWPPVRPVCRGLAVTAGAVWEPVVAACWHLSHESVYTEGWSGPSAGPAQGQRHHLRVVASRNTHTHTHTYTYIHTKIYHMLGADIHLAPLLLTLFLSLCIRLTFFLFFLCSLGVPFMCFAGCFIWSFLLCHSRWQHGAPLCCLHIRKVVSFCLPTIDLMPCTKSVCLRKLCRFIVCLKIFLFWAPKSRQWDWILPLLSTAFYIKCSISWKYLFQHWNFNI